MRDDLLQRMEREMDSFSKGQRQIATYIINHYEKSAYMTASKLGAAVNVSESTVVRFAIELGFAGYPEFQRAMQNIIRNRLKSFQRIEVTNHLIGGGDVLEKVLTSDVDKIKHTLDTIDREAFDGAVDQLIAAKNIYVFGVRSSFALATTLSYSLRMVFDNVHLIQSTSGSEVFEQMLGIGPDDVLIAISFPRYSKRVVNAVEFAHRAGADVVALTDSAAAPIAAYANQLLTAQSDMASFMDSLVAPLSIINALIVALSRKRQEDVTERLRKLEQIWEDYEVYDSQGGGQDNV
ncbi:MAG: MurR/RpiR family transcriptional regulator [Clostridia bacterium]|jgi:DNA-binding MurR/RpiR family transcriptional regulator|nr:MurR/RpiR family transcriptional regulator [Clostridia bacterium]